MPTLFQERLDSVSAEFDHAVSSLEQRLAALDAEVAERPAPDGGWSPAQIVWHVARVNGGMARVLGAPPQFTQPAGPEFRERPWPDVLAVLEPRFEAPDRVKPTGPVARDAAIALLRDTNALVHAAIAALSPGQADGTTWTHPTRAGLVLTLFQVARLAAEHTRRHERQLVRAQSA